VFLLYQFVGGGITALLFGNVRPEREALAFRLSTMLGEILFILVPTFFLARLQSKDWKSLLRLRKADWYYIGLAVIGVVALQQLMEIYLYLQGLIPLPDRMKEIIDRFQQAIDQTYAVLVTANSPTEFFFVVLVVAVTPAVCEETLFRGLVQSNLELPMSRSKAIVLTGAIFAAYHLDPFSFVALCALGIYLSFLVSVSGSIIVPIVAHFTNNFISSLVLYKFGAESLITPRNQKPGAGYLIGWSVVLFLVFLATIRLTMNRNRSDGSVHGGGTNEIGQE